MWFCRSLLGLSQRFFTSVSLRLSVGAGVFATSPEADDSDHLYGWSSDRSHYLWRPVGQVIFTFSNYKHMSYSKMCDSWMFSSLKVLSEINQSNCSCVSQVREADHPDLVVPAAGGAWLLLRPLPFIHGLLHPQISQWDGGFRNHHQWRLTEYLSPFLAVYPSTCLTAFLSLRG